VPRFVGAAPLLEDAARLGAGPPVVALDAARNRLVVTARGSDLDAVREVLSFLDSPVPQVRVRLAVVETLVSERGETGGHALFDRLPGEGPDTVFRGAGVAFEPDAWLRSTLPHALPFPGTDVRFADDSEGFFDAALRSLVARGDAEIHACPNLLLTEGVPGRLESTVELPETVFVGSEDVLTATPVREKAGIVLEATAERVGTDHVVLRVKAWLRQVTAGQSEAGPAGYPVLAVREIEARFTARERRSVVVGGLAAFERTSSRKGIPALARLPLLDAVASARKRTAARTEVVFVATPYIRTPGRREPSGPPGEAERARGQSPAPKRPLDS
jgi:type II secretory pathway component GspD/PulD (secretin)